MVWSSAEANSARMVLNRVSSKGIPVMCWSVAVEPSPASLSWYF